MRIEKKKIYFVCLGNVGILFIKSKKLCRVFMVREKNGLKSPKNRKIRHFFENFLVALFRENAIKNATKNSQKLSTDFLL
jgi:hypothetical protein|tara:strand:+ start:626 stop:865 length:240 start_codon:yes stop_codon:yes gene_type:complete